MPAGHATNKGQMMISCILARSLRASPRTLPSPIIFGGLAVLDSAAGLPCAAAGFLCHPGAVGYRESSNTHWNRRSDSRGGTVPSRPDPSSLVVVVAVAGP